MPAPVILVVEDDPAIQAVLSDLLGDEGYHVVLAAHGQDALIMLTWLRPTAMIVDLRLPVMGGAALLTEMERRKINVPCVVTTAGSSTEAELGDVRSVSAIVPKPFDLEQLLAAVRAACV